VIDVFATRPAWYVLGPLIGLVVLALAALLSERIGAASPYISAIGPVRKGRLWETTAIPEIRSQAAELADRLTAELAIERGEERPVPAVA